MKRRIKQKSTQNLPPPEGITIESLAKLAKEIQESSKKNRLLTITGGIISSGFFYIFQ